MLRFVPTVWFLLACKSGNDRPAEDPCDKATREGPLAAIPDDFPTAQACAKSRHTPVVVELWAPWCHTCLSMQQKVFGDASFDAVKAQFVFAALNTDREINAPTLQRLAFSALPTFYVVAPDGEVLARHVGAASAAQFHHFLDAGAAAFTGATQSVDAIMLRAERALAADDLATADRELTAALAAAPDQWSRRPDALADLISTKSRKSDLQGCIIIAETYLEATGNTAVASDFMATALSCASSYASGDPARVEVLRERIVARYQQLLADPAAPMSVDDRSESMVNLRKVFDDLGKHDRAKAIAEQQRRLIDAAAARAATPLEVMTFDYPRAEVYVYLDRPHEVVPALEKNAADLPDEYEPRARLGWVYFQIGKLAEAAAWTEQAIARVQGPRKGLLLLLRAEIAAAAGDRPTERRFRESAVRLFESLPPGQRRPEGLEIAKQSLSTFDGGGAGSD